MKVIEILNFNRELLKRLQAAQHPSGRCISTCTRTMPAYSIKVKVSYAVAVLSEKYSVSEHRFMPW